MKFQLSKISLEESLRQSKNLVNQTIRGIECCNFENLEPKKGEVMVKSDISRSSSVQNKHFFYGVVKYNFFAILERKLLGQYVRYVGKF